MHGKEIEISGSEALNAISYAEQIEKGVKDSLQQAKELQAYVISSHWNGKTRDAFLSYLELLIQFNTKMAEALEGHTKALKELDKHIQSFTNRPEVEGVKKL
ncbi:WXG100 family type VII secretion target [Bacillus pfraonensis]|uniref:WXG100 family type VII secretion target n=1 Tax=Bacillus TaxID=1386 RepID=UPI001571DF80|nr:MULTISPECIES: WXG100 family type VII secretion target [unclassified Bacillus (in: firmicutes)]MBC6971162.1 WXG100 family type VII secretion target [Bacillus sp. Xin]NSW38145.1 WXG100 family type VII secretion target [Bacillus sp. Xin1]HEK9100046.1 WXG100 family type VII secretion target [Bacillus pseudomycoides]